MLRDERHKKSKHFIVLYHPEPDSFNAAVTAKYCAVIEENNQEAILRDLYRMSARDLSFGPANGRYFGTFVSNFRAYMR